MWQLQSDNHTIPGKGMTLYNSGRRSDNVLMADYHTLFQTLSNQTMLPEDCEGLDWEEEAQM